jgi:hypothetical protein
MRAQTNESNAVTDEWTQQWSIAFTQDRLSDAISILVRSHIFLPIKTFAFNREGFSFGS